MLDHIFPYIIDLPKVQRKSSTKYTDLCRFSNGFRNVGDISAAFPPCCWRWLQRVVALQNEALEERSHTSAAEDTGDLRELGGDFGSGIHFDD